MENTSRNNFHLGAWLKKKYTVVWWTLFNLSLMPSVVLLYQYYQETLGINGHETLIHETGKWALIFLLLSLTITPVRRMLVRVSRYYRTGWGKRMSDWNWIIRLRRMIGNYSFYYASLHLWIFLHFDVDWDWQAFMEETQEKPYIFAGVSAFILLTPLALTSTNNMMRWLGSNWRRLHKLVYLITIIVLLHYWWQVKIGVYTAWPYTVVACLLLGYRMITKYGWLRSQLPDDGMEVPERN